MKKFFKTIFFVVFCVLSLLLKCNDAYAYMASYGSIINEFTIAQLRTDTFIYNYRDIGGTTTELGRETKTYFEGATVTLSAPTGLSLGGKELSTITVNGSGSYSIGDTFTQPSSNSTITYTYVDATYTVSYTGDTSYYTYSNNNLNLSYNQSFTTTITPSSGKTIGTISITMGGADITSMFDTSNNTLTVSQVTGNIVINATIVNLYTISYSGNNFNHDNNATEIKHGDSFSDKVSATGVYTIDSVTVKMGGTDITSTAYQSSDNTISISSVTGNIEITVTTQYCLVEGTQITLYDGTTKNIENIRYNDLLKVWNHDTGTFDYEYAGWIERQGTAYNYTKITFEDGTELKVVGGHSLFSKRLNKYVDINSGELLIGDEVVTLRGGIGYLRVTNIETVNETVNYYHVISTRYFNLIANGLLSTYEIFENVSNFMGFDSDLKWQNTAVVRSDMYTYNDFTYLPKYIFKAFRLEETKYLVNNGLVTPAEFSYLFNQFLTDDNKLLAPPTNGSGTRLWMVTTSDDVDPCNTSHQMTEGSIYTVPIPNNTLGFVNWYNSSDNKYYNPGDTIEVQGGMHLTAIYQ